MWIDVTNNTIPDGNATGNGIDDDAIPLQKVFDFVTNKNAAATSPTGRDVIYFPPGRYRIGTTLVLEKGWGTRLVGAGNALGTELYLGGHARHAGAAVLFWTGDPGLSLLKVFGTFLGTIENLTFCGGAPQRYEFSDSTTNGDPGDGTLRFNATLTEIYIDLESLDSGDITWLLDSLDEGPAPRLTITNLDVSNSFRLFDVAAVHSETGYRRVAVNLVQEQGTFSDTNKVRLDFRRSAGSPQKFGFSTSTSGAPGTGKLAFNSTSLSSVTELRINELNLNDQDVSAWTATFDESLSRESRSGWWHPHRPARSPCVSRALVRPKRDTTRSRWRSCSTMAR
jgi:hypothetical protein